VLWEQYKGRFRDKRTDQGRMYGSSDGLTTDQKNAKLEEEKKDPNVMKEKGYKGKGSKYWFKPSNGGYTLGYDPTLAEADEGFDIDSTDIQEYVPDGYAVGGDVVLIKPTFVDEDGKNSKVFVPVYKIEDTVTPKQRAWRKGVKKSSDKTKRYNDLNDEFDKQGTSVIIDVRDVDGKKVSTKYSRDEKGNIYRLNNEVTKKEVEMPYSIISEKVGPYFDGLGEVFEKKDAATEAKPERDLDAESASITEANKDVPWVKRFLEGNKLSVPDPVNKGSGKTSSHLLSYHPLGNGKAIVFPRLVEENGKLKFMSEDEAREYAIKNNTAIEMDEEMAKHYSENGLIDHRATGKQGTLFEE